MHWLVKYHEDQSHFDSSFCDYVTILNEVTLSREKTAIGIIAAQLIKNAFRRAVPRMREIFDKTQESKAEFVSIVLLVYKYKLRVAPFARFFHSYFPKEKRSPQEKTFRQAIKERDYETLCDYLSEVSFLDHFLTKYPNSPFKLRKVRFAENTRLLDALPFVHTIKSNETGYHHQNYMITHIVLALNHYGETRLPDNRLTRRVLRYLQREFATIRYQARDLDLLAEVIYCFKIYQRDHLPYVQEAIRYMLSQQHPDGSWGTKEELAGTPYEAIHPTWTVITALSFPGSKRQSTAWLKTRVPRKQPAPHVSPRPGRSHQNLKEIPRSLTTLEGTHADGTVPVVTFTQRITIQGIPCEANRLVKFHRSGKLLYATLSHKQVLRGIEFAAGTTVEFHENGQLWRATLSRDRWLEKIPCKAGVDWHHRVVFYPHGTLKRATLSKDHTIQGIPSRAGSTVQFHTNGKLWRARLSRDHRIGGSLYKGGEWIGLYPNGRLHTATLPKNLVIQGVSAKGGVGTRVSFYRNGKLKGTTLSRDHVFQRLRCKGGSVAQFYPGGQLNQLTLAAGHKFHGIAFKSGTLVVLRLDGTLDRVKVGSQRRVKGYPAKADTFVLFHKNGKIKELRLSRDYTIQKIRCAEGSRVRFHDNGTIMEADLVYDKDTIQGIPCSGQTKVTFHSNGRLRSARLSREHTIGGVKYKAGANLVFDSSGTPRANRATSH